MTALDLVNSMAITNDEEIAPVPTTSVSVSVSVSATTQPSLLASPKSTLSISHMHERPRRRSRIFELFSSSKSQPPPARISLSHANSCSAIPVDTKRKNKSKRKHKRKHNRNATETDNTDSALQPATSPSALSLTSSPTSNPDSISHRRPSTTLKLKAILSGLFAKKTGAAKSRPRPQRSLSFSMRKRSQSKAKCNKHSQKRKDKETATKRKNKRKTKEKVNKIRKLNEKHSKQDSATPPTCTHHAKTSSCHTLSHTHCSADSAVACTLPRQPATHQIARSTTMHNSHSFTLHGIEEQKEHGPDAARSSLSEEDLDLSNLSETEEYKDEDEIADLPNKPALRPKSSSFMRAYEKRPEYTTYYAPASLMHVFNNIPMDEQPQSLPLEMRLSMEQRQSSVDQLFETASNGAPMDYGNFYGYHDHDTSEFDTSQDQEAKLIIQSMRAQPPPQHDDEYVLNEPNTDVSTNSVLSSLPDDEEYDEQCWE